MSTATSSNSSRNPSKCKCSVPPALLTSWTSHNPGRRFLACKFCCYKYFRWVDEEQSEWQRDVINQLLLEKKLLQSDNDNLRVEKSQLVEQVIELRAENHLMKKKMDFGEVYTVPLESRMKRLPKILYVIVFALILAYVTKQVLVFKP
ncbi:hypothetical protein RND81_11G153500 [Saponaria officinalis]|uniref:Zinc finger GRF-type domain-containing protein n=1 Tax=Saponaria officinalis TaxID=3572 RepID=A0AAW1HMH9_SAPOF